MTSFSEALQKRDHPAEALDPRTGEVIDFYEARHEYLVDVFVALQDAERRIKEWRTVVEDELVRRHEAHDYSREPQVIGSHSVEVDRPSTRVWDIDDLEGVITDLTDRGVLDPRDTEGLIREKREVNGIAMKKLIDHADGDLLMELSRCFTWKKGRAKVKVTPVVQLKQRCERPECGMALTMVPKGGCGFANCPQVVQLEGGVDGS